MIRNRYLALCAVLTLALLVVFPVQAAKTYQADSFDMSMDIQQDGSLIVTETVVFRFDGGPFTYVFRHIERDETDGIEVLETSMDGISFPIGTEAGQVEITDGDPIEITWHFDPATDSTHEYVVRYRVMGAVRTGTADEIVWPFIPASHDYVIEHASVTLTFPAGAQPIDEPTLDVDFEASAIENGFHLTTGEIEVDQEVTLTALFESGSVAMSTPGWQLSRDESNNLFRMAVPFGLGAAILIGVFFLMEVVNLARSFKRKDTSSIDGTQTYPVLPAVIAPALAARLIGSSTTFLGTLFDLARRGVIRIEEGAKKWGVRQFEMVRLASDTLKPHEKVFIDASFLNSKERADLTSVASLAYNTKFSRALDDELTEAGWRDSERVTKRTRFLVITGSGSAASLPAFVLGILFAFLATPERTWMAIAAAIFIGAGISLFSVGLTGLAIAGLTSTLSDEGLRQASAWNRFCSYLKRVSTGKEPEVSPELFERYLPYAAGMGIATEWTKHFEKMSNLPIPEWLQSLQPGMDDGSFVAILAAVTAIDSSVSSSSGADGGSSGGGASGAG